MTFVAHCTLVLSLQRESGGKVAMIGYSQVSHVFQPLRLPVAILNDNDKVIFSVAFQWAFTGAFPTLFALLGMTLIMVAGVWTTVSDHPLEWADFEQAGRKVESNRTGGRQI